LNWPFSPLYFADSRHTQPVLILDKGFNVKDKENTKPSYEELEKKVEELEDLLRRKEISSAARDEQSSTDILEDQLHFQKTLFDTIPNPLFYKDRNGIYLGCNKSFSHEILGVPPETIIGSSLYDLPDQIPRKLADKYFAQDQELLKTSGLQVYETKVKCADGKIRDFIFYKSTYPDHAGNVAGIIGLMLDVTEKNQIQRSLEESEEKYRSMMDSMNDGVYICAPDFTISYMNPKMIRQVGYDATGQKCHKTLHNLEEPCSWCTFRQITQGNITNAEVQSPRDGRTYLVTNSPIQHLDGTISKMTIYRDISERITLEKELLMAKKLEAAGVFAGGIAHDYNNLLFIILGNLLLLKDDLQDHPGSLEFLESIEEAAQKAAALTKRLLAFTHNESLALEKVSVNTIIDNVLETMNEKDKYPVDLILPDAPLHAYADSSLISKVLKNIIENSREALGKEGSIVIEAEKIVVEDDSELIKNLLLKNSGEYVRIAVSDNGSGIADDIRPHIFDPYFSTKQKGVQKGLGLGLSTSYSIIKKHNGDLRLESRHGMATTMTLYLPVNYPAST
jgi:PAS domain S-box-containing protein